MHMQPYKLQAIQSQSQITCSTLVAPGSPANVTPHCTSVLLLVHQFAERVTVDTVTGVVPIVMASGVALRPPNEPAMVAVPAARGRSRFSRVVLPRLAISLAVVSGVTPRTLLAA